MQNIPGKYASGLYDYVSADISEDGKTLTKGTTTTTPTKSSKPGKK